MLVTGIPTAELLNGYNSNKEQLWKAEWTQEKEPYEAWRLEVKFPGVFHYVQISMVLDSVFSWMEGTTLLLVAFGSLTLLS